MALIELAAAARSGDPAVGGPPTVGAGLSTTARRVLDAFGSQLDRLPVGTRLALLVAAAEDTGELGVVLDAVQRMGVGLSDFEPAERAQLVRVVDDVVTFRHPLIRSPPQAASTTKRQMRWRLRRYGQTGAADTRRARRRTNGPRGLPRTRWCGAGGWPPRRWVRVTAQLDRAAGLAQEASAMTAKAWRGVGLQYALRGIG